MADEILGTKLASGVGVAWEVIGPQNNVNQRAVYSFVPDRACFAKALGFWGRKAGNTNPGKPQLAIYEADTPVNGQLTPTNRLGFTAALSVSAGAGSAGANHEGLIQTSINDATLGVQGAAIRLRPGKGYQVVIHNEAFSIDVAYPSATTLAKTEFRRNAPTGDPTGPTFGPSTNALVKMGSVYMLVTISTAPELTIVGPIGSISTSQPVMSATVFDPDMTGKIADRVSAYKIELRRSDTTQLLWQPDEFPVTGGAGSTLINHTYNGPTLTEGSYLWRMQATDDSGAVGDWTDWTAFSIENLGSFDVTNAAPQGKQDNPTLPSWSARWLAPSLSVNAIKVKILSNGVLLRGGDITPDWLTIPPVAPGGFVTVLDSLVGMTRPVAGRTTFGPMPAGTFTWQIQGKDTNGGISPWSADVPLVINSLPNKPTELRPQSGDPITGLPAVLDWLVSDADTDDMQALGSALQSDIQIDRLDANQSVISTSVKRTTNADLVTGRMFYNLQSTDAPFNNTDYQWRTRGVDVSAYLLNPILGLGPWSDFAIFRLISAAVVKITAPGQGEEVHTSSPEVRWTVESGSQTSYSVEVANANNPTPFFFSEFATAGAPNTGAYTIPANVLQNGGAYDIQVVIRTNTGLTSRSVTPRRITVQFDPADTLQNVNASTVVQPNDYLDEATAVRVTWDITGYNALQFAGYVVTRRLGTQEPGQSVTLAHIKQPNQLAFTDYHPPPNVQLIYGVTQLKKVGSEIHPGNISDASTEVPLRVPVIASLLRGQDLRARVWMLSDDLAEGFTKQETLVATWGNRGRPTLIRSPEGYGQRSMTVGFRLRANEVGSLHQHMEEWRALVRSGHPVSVRTETERIFMAIIPGAGWMRRGASNGVYEVRLSLEEIAWNESVPVRT